MIRSQLSAFCICSSPIIDLLCKSMIGVCSFVYSLPIIDSWINLSLELNMFRGVDCNCIHTCVRARMRAFMRACVNFHIFFACRLSWIGHYVSKKNLVLYMRVKKKKIVKSKGWERWLAKSLVLGNWFLLLISCEWLLLL